MAVEVKLPRLGQGMESGTIVRWLKSEGERVEKGDPLYELDTEKVTQEVEAEASGVLLKIEIAEGEVEVGRTVGVIGEEGEQVAASGNGAGAATTQAAEETPSAEPGPAPAATEVEDSGPETTAERPAKAPAREEERERGRAAAAEAAAADRDAGGAGAGRVKASPLARRIARERGIDLAGIQGTGPDGRIVAEDLERAAAGPAAAPAPTAAAAPTAAPAPAPGAIEVESLSSMRRTIARRLTEAWTIPVFHLTVSADMTRAAELLARIRAAAPQGAPKATHTDVLAKISAAALMRHRGVNARFGEEGIELWPTANVGIAVAIPKGLIVPVIPGVERLSVLEIAAQRAALVERARAGKLTSAELDGGTFTISNLGMFGIESFTAVVNPPQAAILAVGATEQRPVVRDGGLEILPMLTLTLTCDHRTIDGATGAEFLQTLKAMLEEPGLAL